MASLGSVFDATTVEPAKKFEPLPAGSYKCVIVKSEWKNTKNGKGRYVELTFEVLAPEEHKGRRVFDRLNLENQSTQAVEIAQRTLSAICHATGVMQPKDTAELHNIPLVLEIAVKERADKPGEYSNEVAGYLSTEAAMTGQKPAPPQTNKAPWE